MKISIINFQDRLEVFTWQGYKVPDPQEMAYYDRIYQAETEIIVGALNKQGVSDVHVGRNMDEIKGSDGLFLIAPHRPVGIMQSCHAQTKDGALILRQELNGMPCTELTLRAAYAGALGIPTLLVFGDPAFLREAERNLPRPIETLSSEIDPASFAELRAPFSKIGPELTRKTGQALANTGQTKSFPAGPVTLKFLFRYQGMMEKFCRFPFVREETDWSVIETAEAVEAWQLYQTAGAGLDFWNFKIAPQ